jgi:integrase
MRLLVHWHRHIRQLEERLASGSLWRDTGLVFTNLSGGPLEPITLHRNYKRLLIKAGIPKETRFHDLRHCCASLLLAHRGHAHDNGTARSQFNLAHSQHLCACDAAGHAGHGR